MLLPERSADIPLANSALFALPSMVPVRQAIDGEFDRYIARHGRTCRRRRSASARALISNCSTARCFIRQRRGSCWPASSTAWTALTSRKQTAARSA
jgi:hypothetical protein